MKRTVACVLTIAGALVAAVAPARAHHSFASFDSSKTQSVHGAIYRVEWTAPHMWLWLKADDGVLWGIEAGAPSQLEGAGYRRGDLAEGAKLTAMLHPLRDGRHGGSLLSLKLDAGGRITGLAPQQNTQK